MQFVLNINVDNADFGDNDPLHRDMTVAEILRNLSDKVEAGELDHGFFETIRDFNGNDIGRAAFKKSVEVRV